MGISGSQSVEGLSPLLIPRGPLTPRNIKPTPLTPNTITILLHYRRYRLIPSVCIYIVFSPRTDNRWCPKTRSLYGHFMFTKKWRKDRVICSNRSQYSGSCLNYVWLIRAKHQSESKRRCQSFSNIKFCNVALKALSHNVLTLTLTLTFRLTLISVCTQTWEILPPAMCNNRDN